MRKTILVIHPRLCIRAVKQIKGLLSETDYKIIVISAPNYINRFPEFINNERVEFISYGFSSNIIKRYKFRKLLKNLKHNFDIVHCHNEPNYHVVDTIKIFSGKKPIVYDIHDMTSMRSNKEEKDERYAYLNSDAIIHISDEFVYNGEIKYGKQNCHVILSSPSIHNFQRDVEKKKIDFNELHFVYQGGLYDPTWKNAEKFIYRNYLPLFTEILNEGHHVHLYPSLPLDKIPTYKNLAERTSNFHIYEKLEYSQLIKELSKYDFGITGFNFDEIKNKSVIQFLNTVIGNKLFDYAFAKTPTIVVNAKTMGEFAEKHGFGIIKPENKTWTETLISWEPTVNYEQFANEFCMEKQILKLIKLYNDLLNIK